MGDGPRAEVTQLGRWLYRVTIVDGLMVYGPDGYGWRRIGRGRAVRKARRGLARYTAAQRHRAAPIVIESEASDGR